MPKAEPQHDKPLDTAWCHLTKGFMARRRISQTRLAELLKVSQAYVWQCLTGRCRPPINQFAEWEQALRLSPEEAHTFRWTALEAYTPAAVWSRIVELEESLDSATLQLRELGGQLGRLSSRLADLGVQDCGTVGEAGEHGGVP